MQLLWTILAVAGILALGIAALVNRIKASDALADLAHERARSGRQREMINRLTNLVEETRANMRAEAQERLNEAATLILSVDDNTWGGQTTDWRVKAQQWRERMLMLVAPLQPRARHYHGRTREEIDADEETLTAFRQRQARLAKARAEQDVLPSRTAPARGGYPDSDPLPGVAAALESQRLIENLTQTDTPSIIDTSPDLGSISAPDPSPPDFGGSTDGFGGGGSSGEF
jgi:hypothetical protein